MLGILLIDKPSGITSHDVVNQLRRRFHTRRVGHAGTLDPMATGLLVAAVGSATRFLQYLPLEPKEYICAARFGRATDTQDVEGEVVHEGPVPDGLGEAIEQALPEFRGLIEQLPPMFSAVKVQGKPLYVAARKGEVVERSSRTVHIDQFELLGVEDDLARFRIVCSGGTYVRTLVHDLGMRLGCGAHLTEIRRLGAGRFRVDDAVDLANADQTHLMPLRLALPPMPILGLNGTQEAAIRQGQKVGMRQLPMDAPRGKVALMDERGDVFGVARLEPNALQPECVIPLEIAHDHV